MTTMTASERQAIAHELGVSDQYLYQCLTGRKLMRPEEAVRIEKGSGGRLRRWDVRRSDWHRIWPELVDADGAPRVSDTESTDA